MGAELLRGTLGCEALVLGGEPDGRYDHPPEPTEGHLKILAAIVPAVGADLGFAQDPDADRLAIVDETGAYIGEELTLALAVQRRLMQATGPVVLNLSTSRVAEDLAARLPGAADPGRRDPRRGADAGGRGAAGRRGQRRRHRSPRRVRARQLRGHGLGARFARPDRCAVVAPGRGPHALRDGQGEVPSGQRRAGGGA